MLLHKQNIAPKLHLLLWHYYKSANSNSIQLCLELFQAGKEACQYELALKTVVSSKMYGGHMENVGANSSLLGIVLLGIFL